jgi:hypothetical protein
MVSATLERIAEGHHDDAGRQRLADDDDRQGGQHLQRLAQQHPGVEQHADRHEEQHREGVAQRQRLLAAWWLNSDSRP